MYKNIFTTRILFTHFVALNFNILRYIYVYLVYLSTLYIIYKIYNPINEW